MAGEYSEQTGRVEDVKTRLEAKVEMTTPLQGIAEMARKGEQELTRLVPALKAEEAKRYVANSVPKVNNFLRNIADKGFSILKTKNNITIEQSDLAPLNELRSTLMQGLDEQKTELANFEKTEAVDSQIRELEKKEKGIDDDKNLKLDEKLNAYVEISRSIESVRGRFPGGLITAEGNALLKKTVENHSQLQSRIGYKMSDLNIARQCREKYKQYVTVDDRGNISYNDAFKALKTSNPAEYQKIMNEILKGVTGGAPSPDSKEPSGTDFMKIEAEIGLLNKKMDEYKKAVEEFEKNPTEEAKRKLIDARPVLKYPGFPGSKERSDLKVAGGGEFITDVYASIDRVTVPYKKLQETLSSLDQKFRSKEAEMNKEAVTQILKALDDNWKKDIEPKTKEYGGFRNSSMREYISILSSNELLLTPERKAKRDGYKDTYNKISEEVLRLMLSLETMISPFLAKNLDKDSRTKLESKFKEAEKQLDQVESDRLVIKSTQMLVMARVTPDMISSPNLLQYVIWKPKGADGKKYEIDEVEIQKLPSEKQDLVRGQIRLILAQNMEAVQDETRKSMEDMNKFDPKEVVAKLREKYGDKGKIFFDSMQLAESGDLNAAAKGFRDFAAFYNGLSPDDKKALEPLLRESQEKLKLISLRQMAMLEALERDVRTVFSPLEAAKRRGSENTDVYRAAGEEERVLGRELSKLREQVQKGEIVDLNTEIARIKQKLATGAGRYGLVEKLDSLFQAQNDLHSTDPAKKAAAIKALRDFADKSTDYLGARQYDVGRKYLDLILEDQRRDCEGEAGKQGITRDAAAQEVLTRPGAMMQIRILAKQYFDQFVKDHPDSKVTLEQAEQFILKRKIDETYSTRMRSYMSKSPQYKDDATLKLYDKWFPQDKAEFWQVWKYSLEEQHAFADESIKFAIITAATIPIGIAAGASAKLVGGAVGTALRAAGVSRGIAGAVAWGAGVGAEATTMLTLNSLLGAAETGQLPLFLQAQTGDGSHESFSHALAESMLKVMLYRAMGAAGEKLFGAAMRAGGGKAIGSRLAMEAFSGGGGTAVELAFMSSKERSEKAFDPSFWMHSMLTNAIVSAGSHYAHGVGEGAGGAGPRKPVREASAKTPQPKEKAPAKPGAAEASKAPESTAAHEGSKATEAAAATATHENTPAAHDGSKAPEAAAVPSEKAPVQPPAKPEELIARAAAARKEGNLAEAARAEADLAKVQLDAAVAEGSPKVDELKFRHSAAENRAEAEKFRKAGDRVKTTELEAHAAQADLDAARKAGAPPNIISSLITKQSAATIRNQAEIARNARDLVAVTALEHTAAVQDLMAANFEGRPPNEIGSLEARVKAAEHRADAEQARKSGDLVKTTSHELDAARADLDAMQKLGNAAPEQVRILQDKVDAAKARSEVAVRANDLEINPQNAIAMADLQRDLAKAGTPTEKAAIENKLQTARKRIVEDFEKTAKALQEQLDAVRAGGKEDPALEQRVRLAQANAKHASNYVDDPVVLERVKQSHVRDLAVERRNEATTKLGKLWEQINEAKRQGKDTSQMESDAKLLNLEAKAAKAAVDNATAGENTFAARDALRHSREMVERLKADIEEAKKTGHISAELQSSLDRAVAGVTKNEAARNEADAALRVSDLEARQKEYAKKNNGNEDPNLVNELGNAKADLSVAQADTKAASANESIYAVRDSLRQSNEKVERLKNDIREAESKGQDTKRLKARLERAEAEVSKNKAAESEAEVNTKLEQLKARQEALKRAGVTNPALDAQIKDLTKDLDVAGAVTRQAEVTESVVESRDVLGKAQDRVLKLRAELEKARKSGNKYVEQKEKVLKEAEAALNVAEYSTRTAFASERAAAAETAMSRALKSGNPNEIAAAKAEAKAARENLKKITLEYGVQLAKNPDAIGMLINESSRSRSALEKMQDEIDSRRGKHSKDRREEITRLREVDPASAERLERILQKEIQLRNLEEDIIDMANTNPERDDRAYQALLSSMPEGAGGDKEGLRKTWNSNNLASIRRRLAQRDVLRRELSSLRQPPPTQEEAMRASSMENLINERERLASNYYENQQLLATARTAKLRELHEQASVIFEDPDHPGDKIQLISIVDDVITPTEVSAYMKSIGNTPMYMPHDMAWTIKINVSFERLTQLHERGKVTDEVYNALKTARKAGGVVSETGAFLGFHPQKEDGYRRRVVGDDEDATPRFSGIMRNEEQSWVVPEINGMTVLVGGIGPMGEPTVDPIRRIEIASERWGMAGPGGRTQAWMGRLDFKSWPPVYQMPGRDGTTGRFGTETAQNTVKTFVRNRPALLWEGESTIREGSFAKESYSVAGDISRVGDRMTGAGVRFPTYTYDFASGRLIEHAVTTPPAIPAGSVDRASLAADIGAIRTRLDAMEARKDINANDPSRLKKRDVNMLRSQLDLLETGLAQIP